MHINSPLPTMLKWSEDILSQNLVLIISLPVSEKTGLYGRTEALDMATVALLG